VGDALDSQEQYNLLAWRNRHEIAGENVQIVIHDVCLTLSDRSA
jgi:hypothetical protein